MMVIYGNLVIEVHGKGEIKVILEISRHIILDESAPKLPNWIFHRDDVIISQRISLGEAQMKELL